MQKYEMRATHLEQPHKVLLGRVNVQSSAQLVHLLKGQFLVILFTGRLPALLYPDCLSDFFISRASHEFLSYRIQLPQRDVPEMECVVRGSDEMERLVLSVEHVNDGDPSVLILACELELLAIIPRVRSRPELLDILDGNCACKGGV